MPWPLAILSAIGLSLILCSPGPLLMGSLVAVPIYYAVRNIRYQDSNKDSNKGSNKGTVPLSHVVTRFLRSFDGLITQPQTGQT
jgi:hypothetical protein